VQLVLVTDTRGHSVIEQLVVVALIALVFGMSLPAMKRGVDHGRLRGAAFYLSSRVAQLRMQAVHRGANVALRFSTLEPYAFQTFMDGDGDGVRSADISLGRDPAIDVAEAIPTRFTGVAFGFVPGCPLSDGTAVPSGADPIRIGASRMLAFAPSGTATSGTLYLRGQLEIGYAVVILGATGRTRLLACAPSRGKWEIDDR
jgi:hypothetical protein